MLLNTCNINSSNFQYSKNLNSFLAEISELGNKFRMGRIYDDACDVGFTMISAKTGKEAVFRLENIEKNEGDILHWDFICVTPGLKNIKAVIFND